MKKLKLNKQTLRVLVDLHLVPVVGGAARSVVAWCPSDLSDCKSNCLTGCP